MAKLPAFSGAARLRALGGGDAALVPSAKLSGPMPWVIAIMVGLTVIALAGGLALRHLTDSAAENLAGGITVQVVEANADLAHAQAERAAARLLATPGVAEVHVVSQDQLDRLIEPWLDIRDAGGEDPIPVPALVDARLSHAVDGETLGALRRSVREVAPAARVDAQSSWLKPVFGAVASLQWLALVLIALLGAATAAAVLLAVRTALGANRDTIEIVHLLGGTDSQIARIFQRAIGQDAALGAVAGLAIGVTAVVLIGRRFAALGAGLIDGGAFARLDWALLGLVPVVGTLLAIVTTRFTVTRALGRML